MSKDGKEIKRTCPPPCRRSFNKAICCDLRKNVNLADITSDFTKNKPEVELVINEKKAKDLGLSCGIG